MEEFPERFFAREDESADAGFYRQPRLVTHIDDATIAALTDFYAEFLPPLSRVLDLMSSWVSHLPDEDFGCVAGLGMNAEELAANPRLTDRVVHDLNEEPVLPFASHSFDRAVVAVSVQYLVRPIEVFADLRRVLAPAAGLRWRCRTAASPPRRFSPSARCRRTTASAWWEATCTAPVMWRSTRWIVRHRTRIRFDRHRGLSTARLRRRDHSCLLARTIHECA